MRSPAISAKRKTSERIGSSGLLLPELINRAMAAHDRLKYFLLLLQSASAYAQAPHQVARTLRQEREASGVPDAALDDVIAASRMVGDAIVRIPNAASIMKLIFVNVGHMLEPVAMAATWRSDLRERAEHYRRRLDALLAQAPSCSDDQLPPSAVAAMTRRSENGHDSVHQLAVDLHWELNRLQSSVAVESIDGASAYGLTEADRLLVRAFMKGVNETAPLKLDHPGFVTTASRDGDRVSIQSELGATDVHAVVVHVSGLTVTVIYADQHRPRIRFFREMLQPYDVRWEAAPRAGSGDHEMAVGRYTAAAADDLEAFLTRVGSRLVFLVDWNRARKRLSRFVKSADAVALLKWAADNNIGHRAFLEAGDSRLIDAALERAAPTQMRYGARLDDLLGRDAARLFLMSVLRIASAGVSRGTSPRLIDDEIEAELLPYVRRSDRTMLSAAADHAMVIEAAVEWIGRALTRLKNREPHPDHAATFSLIRSWRSRADEIARRTIRMLNQSPDAQPFKLLMADGATAVKAVEEAALTLTLVPHETDGTVLSLLDSLCGLVAGGIREYVRCLEEARDLAGGADRSGLDRFLVTIDRLVALDDQCDEAERAVLERLVRGSSDFRELHLCSAIGSGLDAVYDSVARSCLIVRDYVLGIAPES